MSKIRWPTLRDERGRFVALPTYTAYETCSMCRGSGMHDYGVSIGTCPYCHGDCYVRARDERGRFTVKEIR